MTVFTKVSGAAAGLVLLALGVWAVAKYDVAGSLFSTRFMPHQYCYLRDPGLVWSNAISDGLIWLSYVAIAAALGILLRKTRTLLAFRWVFVAFGLFIVACGFTHFFEALTLWVPLYWLSTAVKVLTAGASVATAMAFAPLVPRAAEAIRLFHEKYSTSEVQRVEALSRLLDAEERMKLAVDSAGIGTWEYSPASKELHWDERCCKVMETSYRQQVSYEDFLQHVHPEDRPQVEGLLNTTLAGNGAYNAAFRVVSEGGSVRHVMARGKLFCNQAGQALRLAGTAMDVTKERQAEESLLKAEKLAAAGRMAASIAHEINNPLSAAVGLLYLVRTQDGVSPSARERLEAVEHELQRAALITRSTLTFYRESPNPLPVNPVELVESVLSFQQGNIAKSGVRIETSLVYSQPISAFPGELRQIVTNLVANAVEATQPGGKVTVRVRPTRNWRSGNDGYRIVVADNGPGIPGEVRKKLFSAFYTTKGDKGTGLGLWVTGQLVEKHEGTIKLRSCCTPRQPRGTVFSVWLPLVRQFAPSGSAPNAA
jgi:PAS domain S-box-containing protein